MRLFVTGATGVIGRRAVPMLVRDGHDVTALVRSLDRMAVFDRLHVRPVLASLFDPDALRRAMDGHEVVINLATHIPPSSSQMMLRRAWRENDRIRSAGSATLVDAAIASSVGRFIQESFAGIYPDCGDAWISEETALAPVRYNRTILDAERSARRFSESGGEGIVLRFAQFYGPDAMQTRDMIAFVRKGWAPIPGRADAFVSSVSHDDAASAVVAALEAPPGIYNVVEDEPLRRREYFDALAAALGAGPPRLPPAWMTPLFGALGEMLSRSIRMSNRRFKDETRWTPEQPSVRAGWRSTIDALRASGDAD